MACSAPLLQAFFYILTDIIQQFSKIFGLKALSFPTTLAFTLFGLNSGAALATVVGVLVEVPVMLSLATFANRTRFLPRYGAALI